MGKTYRRLNKKQKESLRSKRQKRANARRIEEDRQNTSSKKKDENY